MEKKQLIDLIEILKECEYRIENDDITVWIDFYQIRELTQIFGCDHFSESGIDVKLQYECIAFDLSELLYEVADDDDWKIIRKELSSDGK